MTILSIEVDGKWYHAQMERSDDPRVMMDCLVPILDENEEMIPKSQCLCAAHSSSECCCGAWDNVPEPDWELDIDWD